MSTSGLLNKLNEEQKRAVTHTGGPLLIVAGAGTGKTTVITSRLAWLLAEGLAKPEEILAITFTDKAAQEMQERVDQLLPFGYLDLWISTFHALGQRVLERHGLDIGISNDFKLLTQTESWLLMRRNLAKFNLDYYRPLGNPGKFIHALIKHFSRCKDEEIAPQDYLEHAENIKLNHDSSEEWGTPHQSELDTRQGETRRLREIANAYHIYNQLLLDNNALDFGDLINYTLKLFRERPKIIEDYRHQFKYILVDEFQDTNLAQYQLIKLLAGLPERANLTVVGDHQQAIYKFRGASLANILHFNQDFPNAAKIFLTQNYRSPQNILNLSHEFIQLNPGQTLPADSLNQEILNQKLQAAKAETGRIELITALTAEGEARAVAKKILGLKNGKNSWSDFAILLRANSQADIFINTLDEAGLPHQFLASSGLYRTPLVLDILSWLRLLDDYHDNTAVYRVCNLAPWHLPSEELIKIIHLSRKKSWSLYFTLKHNQLIELSGETKKLIERMLTLAARHAASARTTSVRQIVQLFLEESGYLKKILEEEKTAPVKYARNILYLNKFIEGLTEFEQNHTEKHVKNYLAELEYILDSGEEGSLSGLINEGPESIKIMTVHSAKGLEFKYVFIVNLVDLRFPAINRSEPISIPDELVKEILPRGDVFLEEERRLFYVAMTRAKEGLFFTLAQNYGGSRTRKPSRFLYEAGVMKKDGGKEGGAKIVTLIAAQPFGNKVLGEVEGSRSVTVGDPSPMAQDDNKGAAGKNLTNLPKKFSFTQLKAFQTCPYQYKFRHILNIPVRGRGTFSFGKTMHTALQKFYQRLIELNTASQLDLFSEPSAPPNVISSEAGDLPQDAAVGAAANLKAPPLEDLLKFYEESWIDDWFEDAAEKERYREQGRRSLKEFYESNQGRWTKPMGLEKGFNLRLSGYTLTGQIDRIDELPDGTVEIIDYKTGQVRSENNIAAEDKEQLLIYQIATVDLLQKKPSLLSFYYLNQNKKLSFLGTDEDLTKLKDKIIKTIEQIKTSDFRAAPSPQVCKNCDYRNICEFRV